uniref:Uncharacterized protein n=1 Tax=Steinernema glaseri TaxID=37863 RepID=A0A1I7ZH38_9BILA
MTFQRSSVDTSKLWESLAKLESSTKKPRARLALVDLLMSHLSRLPLLKRCAKLDLTRSMELLSNVENDHRKYATSQSMRITYVLEGNTLNTLDHLSKVIVPNFFHGQM